MIFRPPSKNRMPSPNRRDGAIDSRKQYLNKVVQEQQQTLKELVRSKYIDLFHFWTISISSIL